MDRRIRLTKLDAERFAYRVSFSSGVVSATTVAEALDKVRTQLAFGRELAVPADRRQGCFATDPMSGQTVEVTE